MKAHLNAGVTPRLSFFRDTHGLEVDLLAERGSELVALEAKSGATVPLDAFGPLEAVRKIIPELREGLVVHGGTETWTTSAGRALSFRDLPTLGWGLPT